MRFPSVLFETLDSKVFPISQKHSIKEIVEGWILHKKGFLRFRLKILTTKLVWKTPFKSDTDKLEKFCIWESNNQF